MAGHWTDATGETDPFPPDGCTCDHGWRTVGPAYPETMFPGDLPAMVLAREELMGRIHKGERPDPAVLRALTKAIDSLSAQRAFAAESVFPCPTCRPVMYGRWRNGCYRLGHRRFSCKTCGPNAASAA